MGKTKINTIGAEISAKKTGGREAYEKKRAAREARESGNQVPGSQLTENPKPETRNLEPDTRIASPVKIQRETVSSVQETSHRRGKKYKAAKAKLEEGRAYSLKEATKLVRETSFSKFPGSVELHLVLLKDSLNQKVTLPYSTGVTKKIEIANDDTVKKLEAGKIDFDVLIATPATMPKLVPFAKLLGPKGLLPNPKNGTLVEDTQKAVSGFAGNNIQLKTEKEAPQTHNVIGKTNQPQQEIEENISAVITALGGTKTIQKAVISASMGPGIQIAV